MLSLHDESNCFKSFFPGLIPNGLLAAFACSCHSMCSIFHLLWQDQGIVAKGINFIQAQSAPKDDFIKKKLKKNFYAILGIIHGWKCCWKLWLLIAFLLSDVILLILVEKGFHSLWLDKRGSNKCHDCTPQRHLFGEIS